MKKIFLMMVFAAGMCVLPGCDKEDDSRNPGGNELVASTFESMYSGATRVEWEREGQYWKASFRKDSKEMEAWFSLDGQWYQTETDLLYADLPTEVKTAFESGDYKTWRVEDVDKIERRDTETYYVLNVESGHQEYYLHYSPEGVFLQAVEDRF